MTGRHPEGVGTNLPAPTPPAQPVCTCTVVGSTPMGAGYPDQLDYEQNPSCPVHSPVGVSLPDGALVFHHPAYPGMLTKSWHHDYTPQGKDTPMANQAPTDTEVTEVTEYGIRHANGTTVWTPPAENGATTLAVSGTAYTIATREGINEATAARAILAYSAKASTAALTAGLPYDESLRPSIVSRRIITLTSAPVVVDLSMTAASFATDPF